MAQPSLVDTIIKLATGTYDPCATNDARQRATSELYALRDNEGRAVEVCVAALEVLRNGALSSQIRCCAGSMIDHALRRTFILPGHVPFREIAAFLADPAQQQQLDRLMVVTLSNIVVTCAAFLWPKKWPDLLSVLCPEEQDLSAVPPLLRCLAHLVYVCADPPGLQARLGREQANELRRAIVSSSRVLGQKLISCLGQQYVKAVARQQQQQVDDRANADIEVAIEALQMLIPLMPAGSADWWALNVDGALGALVSFPPTARDAVFCCGALIAANKIQPGDTRGAAFIRGVFSFVTTAIASEDWQIVQELLDCALTLGQSALLAETKQTLLEFSVRILAIPSILFGQLACEVFLRSIDAVSVGFVTPSDVLPRLRDLSAKCLSNPTLNLSPAAEFSRNQFATLESYEHAFGDFRTSCGEMLRCIAVHFPGQAIEFVKGCMEQLAAPSATDTRGPYGHVTQTSAVFGHWSAALFCIDQLLQGILVPQVQSRGVASGGARTVVASAAPAPSVSSTTSVPPVLTVPGVEEALTAAQHFLLNRLPRPTDATLIPLYLNMIGAFWVGRGGGSASSGSSATTLALPSSPSPLNRWVDWASAMDVIFFLMRFDPRGDIRAGGHHDLDLVSGRKRAFTLFVSACVHHAPALFPLMNEFQTAAQQMASRRLLLASEQTFLFEALVSLSNGMPDAEQRGFLSSLLAPHLPVLQTVAETVTAQSLAVMVCGDASHARERRQSLVDATSLLASVLRRCRPSPYMAELATSCLGVFVTLVSALHGMGEYLPAGFEGITGLDEAETHQLMGAGTRRPMEERGSLVKKARHLVSTLRVAAYQSVGALARFLGIDALNAALGRITAGAENFQVHVARMLCEHCLGPLTVLHPPLAMQVLPFVGSFLLKQASLTRSDSQDIADARQLFYFTMDQVKLVRETLVATKLVAQHDDLRTVVLEFLLSTLRAGFNARVSVDLILELLPTLPAATQLALFGEMAVRAAKEQRLQPREREILLNLLGDLYLREMPRFGDALVQAGMPAEAVEELNNALAALPRIDGKRKKFRDTLCGS